MATYIIENKETIELLKQSMDSRGVVTNLKRLNDELMGIYDDFIFYNSCTAPSLLDKHELEMDTSNKILAILNGRIGLVHFYQYEIENDKTTRKIQCDKRDFVSDKFRFYASFKQATYEEETYYRLDVLRYPLYSKEVYPELSPTGEVCSGDLKVKLKTAESSLYNLFLTVRGTLGISFDEIRGDKYIRDEIIEHYVKSPGNRGRKCIEEALNSANITRKLNEWKNGINRTLKNSGFPPCFLIHQREHGEKNGVFWIPYFYLNCRMKDVH